MLRSTAVSRLHAAQHKAANATVISSTLIKLCRTVFTVLILREIPIHGVSLSVGCQILLRIIL